MTALAAWLAREGRRQAARSDLLGALVLGQGAAYVRYRLGFVLARLLFRTALHAVEISFLARAMPYEYLAPLLSYRALAAMATTFHWGALESLRRDVRSAVRSDRGAIAARLTEGWLSASTLGTVLPTLWLCSRILPDGFGPDAPGVSLFDAYALACCLRFCCDVFARTFHAGVFAIRRVYRPLATLLCADAVEVAVIVLGFDSLGAWSIPLAMVAAGLVDAVLSLYYAQLAYRRGRLQSPRLWPRLGAFLQLRVSTLRTALVQSFANAGMQLDAWLLLILVRVDPPRSDALSFATVYYVLRPLLGLATHWVRSFYFDLSALDSGGFACFRPRLLWLLRRVALGCAGSGAGLTMLIAWLLWPRLWGPRLLWLLPFFVARAVFALAQLEAFAAARYRVLVVTTLLLAVALAAVSATSLGGGGVIAFATLLLSAASIGLARSQRRAREVRTSSVLGLSEWLAALRQEPEVRMIVLRTERVGMPVTRVMLALAAAFPALRMARCGMDSAVLFGPAQKVPTRTQLIGASAGTLSRLWISESCRGSDGLCLARAHAILPQPLDAALASVGPTTTIAEVERSFRAAFPHGRVLDVHHGVGTLDAGFLPRAQLGAFIRYIVAASRQREVRTRLPVEAAVYAPDGAIRLVFVVPRSTAGFGFVRAQVLALTLRASAQVAMFDHAPPRRALAMSAVLARLTRP